MRTVFRAFSYRLYPSSDQAALMAQSAGVARAIYNAALDQRSVAFKMGHRVTRRAQDLELKDLKRSVGLEYLAHVHSDVLVQALWDADRAFERFFKGLAAYPKFKAKSRSRDCGHQDNADVNAAINIREAALAQHQQDLAAGLVVTAHGDLESEVNELRTTCIVATTPVAA